MFAHYTQGSSYMRELTADDVSGICSIYLPGGQRAVDPIATFDGSGVVDDEACDPTPRHGFSTECASNPSKACEVAEPPARAAWAPVAGGALLGVACLRRARRRRR
jgi:hypothetical protein